MRAGWLACAAWLAGCYGPQDEKLLGEHRPFVGCSEAPTAPPATLNLDPFYAKYLDATGIPVLASAAVADQAVQQACRIVGEMASQRGDARQAMVALNIRVAVIGQKEATLDIPEYRDLPTSFPKVDWNVPRGLGATVVRPVASASEENLLCRAGDPDPGHSILAFTFACALELGLNSADAGFADRLNAAYRDALARGVWNDPESDGDVVARYWATGVQTWFAATEARARIRTRDPALATLLAEALPDDNWRSTCPK